MNEIIKKEEIKVENMIYEIRGKQVMLDSDVARLYGYDTKRINEIVKRNINKFYLYFDNFYDIKVPFTTLDVSDLVKSILSTMLDVLLV